MKNKMRQNRIVNRRPLAALAVCLAAGIVLGRYVDFTDFYFAAAAVTAAAAVCLYAAFKKAKYAAAFLCAALAFFGAFLASAAVNVPRLPDGIRKVTGYVAETPYVNGYGSRVCVLDGAEIDGQPCGGIKLYAPAMPALKCGDVIEADCSIKTPDGVRNPGGFDERLYLLSEGIRYKAYADAVNVTGRTATFKTVLADIRAGLSGVIDSVFSVDTAPAAKAMLLGDKQALDEDVYQAFKDTGLAHVLAVSGLHAAILIAAASFFFRLIRLGRTPAFAATLCFIAVYALVTGLSPSIVRASVMAAVLLIGRHTGRQTDTLSSLAFAFIISLLINPLDLFMAGFQLSFAAVFGLLTLGAQLRRLFQNKLPWRLPDMVSAAVGGTAGTMPILVSSFNRLSVIGLAANIAVLPLASLAIVLVFAATVLGFVTGPSFVSLTADAVIRVMTAVIRALGVLPFAAVNVATPPWFVTAGIFILLFVVSKYLLVPAKAKALTAFALAAAAAFAVILTQPADMTLVFLDVGQGDAAFIRTARGGEYFVDGGPEKSADEVVGFTVRSGITPDAAFVSHTDGDHFSGLVALYRQGLLKKVYCSAQEAGTVAAAMPNAQVVPLSAGDAVLLDDETKAVVLYPYADSAAESKNDLSLVLLVEYKNHTALLTGDISGGIETKLFMELNDVDIYKAAHHGSALSSYRLPLSVLRPDYSVISVGENAFGQPSALTLLNIGDYSGSVYITQRDHAVVFDIGDAVSVRTYGG